VVKLVVLYWRDIPAQVIGKSASESIRKPLAPRFAAAIDRAAMRAGKGSSEAYLNEWRRDIRTENGDLATVVDATVSELEQQFNDDTLERLIRSGGKATP
jgi:hypothetical protein